MTVLGAAAFADDMKSDHANVHGEMDAKDHKLHSMVADMPEGLALGHPVILVAGKSAKSAAGFLVIENTSDTDERLISASADFARTVQLHTHIMEDDVAKMREVEGGFAIAAGGTHALQRGADHIMLMGLSSVPAVGDTVSLTLTFEKAGEVSVPFVVMDAASAGMMDHNAMTKSN